MRKRISARTRREREERREVEQQTEKREYELEISGDIANEQLILGSMLVDPTARKSLLPVCPVDSFTHKDHKLLREAIEEAERQRLEMDPATLLRLRPDLDVREVEGMIAARPNGSPNIDWHVDTLLWDWQRVRIGHGPLQSLLDALGDPSVDRDRVKALGRQVGEAFAETSGRGRFIRDPKDVKREAMSTLRKRIAGEGWFPFGIEGLDHDEQGKRRYRPGAAPQEITILTSRSGTGKTTFASHMARGIAKKKRRVGLGAWEVQSSMTLELMATLELGWPRSMVLDGRSPSHGDDDGSTEPMTNEEVAEFEATIDRLNQHVVFIENPFQRGRRVPNQRRSSNDDHLDILEDQIRESGVEVMICDLFDRLLRDRDPAEEQEALWRLLDIARSNHVHIVAVHQQLLKGADVRKDKKPSVEGMKGSSAYTDVGALILATHMPGRWKNVPDDKLEVYGLKQRYGPPFAVEFGWDGDTGQLSGGRTIKRDELFEDAADEADVPFLAPKKRSERKGGSDRYNFVSKRKSK